MKKYLLYIVLFLCNAQQFYAQEGAEGVVSFAIPTRNSLKFNRHFINPTFSFVREQNKYISFNTKSEWGQFDGAPKTYVFGYSGRFKENIGAGVSLYQQSYGVLTTFGGTLNFAYNTTINRYNNLTFGTNLGFYKSSINTGNVSVNFSDPSLDNFPSNTIITINPGINYGTEFLDFGVSISNLVAYNLASSKMIEDDPQQGVKGHIMYTGYLRNRGFFDESKFFGLITSEFKKEQTVISGMAMLVVPKGIWAQAGYNNLSAFSVGIGLNITSQIAVEYNYEKGLGSFSSFGNSHDITIAFKVNNNDRYDYSGDDDDEALLISSNKRKRKFVVKRKPKKKVTAKETQLKAAKKEAEKAKAEEAKQARIAELERIKAVRLAKAKAAEAARLKAAEERQARIDAQAARAKAVQATAEAAKLKAAEAKQARIAAQEAKAKAAADAAKAKAAEAARLKAAQEEEARIAAEAAKAAADAAKAKAAEAARLKAAQEEEARIAAEATKPKEMPLDETLINFKKSVEASKASEKDLLDKLTKKVASKQKDLDNLKAENDLSEQGIVKEAPRVFKSVSAENAEIENLKLKIDKSIDSRKAKIAEIENLYKARLKKVKGKDDLLNQSYLREIETLKTEQKKAIKVKQGLIATLKTIKAATDYERKRRIKRASYDNESDRYNKDKATLERIKNATSLSSEPLTKEDFDHGETFNDIQIIKGGIRVDKGYYLVVAVHSNVKKRDEFLKKAVAAGEKNINFFFDVNTSKYYIYYEKFNTIGQAKSSLDISKGNKPYNSKMSMVKIEK